MKKYFFILALVFLGAAIYAQDLPDTGSSAQPSAPPSAIPPAEPAADSDNGAETPDEEPAPDDNGPIDITPSYQLSDTAGSVKFIQRLSWDKAQYAVRYTVILERKNEEMDEFQEVLRRNLDADATYIDVSVPAGDYRFRIYGFNVLGQLYYQPDWNYFTVVKAIQPSILSFTPESFFLDRETPRIIDLTGENLLPDTSIYLESVTSQDPDGQPLIIKPDELYLNELGQSARLIINEEDLVAGKYNIIAENPGGLSDSIGPFSISVAKPFDINVSGGYTPNLVIIGHKDQFLDQVFILASISARVSYVPYKLDIGYFGIEANPNWTLFTSMPTALHNESSSAHLLTLNINALYQYWLIRNRLSVNARAGIGLAGLFNFHYEYSSTGRASPSYNTAAFSINAGASVQWFFYKQFYAEGGLDYNQILHTDFSMGFLRIGVYGGYQF
ncbi:MAG: hypothetical protein FWF22_05675 [Treponema sp.]|nr:hypothetical protein [Treponema sp.]